jgi:hypothetical protein
VSTPPAGRVQAPRRGLPPPGQRCGYALLQLCGQSGAGDAELSTGLDVSEQEGQVEVVGADIPEAVDGDHGVEELRGEGQAPGVGAQGVHASPHARVLGSALALAGGEPQVDRPHAHVVLPGQENRGRTPAAAQVQHPHAGRSGSAWVSHSVSRSGLPPPLTAAAAQAGW